MPRSTPPPAQTQIKVCLCSTNQQQLREIHAWYEKRETRQRSCKQREREIVPGWEICNLPLCQPQQHNKVIKSGSFACYFCDDIYPSLSMHLHSLPMCVSHSILLTPHQHLDCPGSEINYLTSHPVTLLHPKLLTLFCFLAFTMNMKFMM